MRSKLYETYGAFKVWERPSSKISRNLNWGLFEVRRGNKVLARYTHLYDAMKGAADRNKAEWAKIAKTLDEMKANGELA